MRGVVDAVGIIGERGEEEMERGRVLERIWKSGNEEMKILRIGKY